MRIRSLVLIVAVLTGACGDGDVEPTLGFGSDTPGDLRQLAAGVFAEVVKAMPAQADCLDGVVLRGAWELDDRARYDPGRDEITVRIPATAAQLEISIVHELAHRVEFVCPQAERIRSDFIAAQGLTAEAWFEGETWETTPSEQWASAVVLHVLDRPDGRARVFVTAEAMEIVQEWAVRR